MTFWALAPTAGAADELDLTVYGYISEAAFWDDEVGAKEFREALDAHKGVARINVRINSGGGDAFAGIAIRSMLVTHPADVLVTVEGLAGSAASLIAMSGHCTMALGSMLMVHNPSALAMGEAKDLRKTAEVLDGLRDSLVAIYQAKTGKTAEELAELLDAETWLTAQDAVDQGFADEVAGEVEAVAKGDAVYYASIGFPRSALPWAARPLDVDEPPRAAAEDDMPITRERLTAEAPELLAALLAEGRASGETDERARMLAIDEVALQGHEALVSRARYEDPMSAEGLAVAILKAERVNREKHLADLQADAGEVDVPAAPLPPEATPEAEAEAMWNGVGAGR